MVSYDVQRSMSRKVLNITCSVVHITQVTRDPPPTMIP